MTKDRKLLPRIWWVMKWFWAEWMKLEPPRLVSFGKWLRREWDRSRYMP